MRFWIMTSYKKMNKQAVMQGFPTAYRFNVVMSKMLNNRKKFPHVKYVNQLIKDNKR